MTTKKTNMATKNTFLSHELNSELLLHILDDIPSDNESCVSGCESENEEVINLAHDLLPSLQVLNENIHDEKINEFDGESENVGGGGGGGGGGDCELLLGNGNIIWEDVPIYKQVANFCSEVGPQVEEDVESPTEMFLSHFLSQLLQHIA